MDDSSNPENQPSPACPACGTLQDVETSFSKHLAPELDRPLPAAVRGLVVLSRADRPGADAREVWRCPRCGALYDYVQTHEYLINGTEEEETLARMDPLRRATYLRDLARGLEETRREIDLLQGAAGRLGDYVDRGTRDAQEIAAAIDDLQAHARQATELRGHLQAWVQGLRRACPEVLAVWAQAHAAVCRSFLESLPATGDDAQTARHVARSAQEAWERLPIDGETFIATPDPWLPGYLERLDPLLRPPPRTGV